MKKLQISETHSRKTVFFLSGALLLLANPVWGNWDKGVEAFKAGNFSQAAQEFAQVVDQSPDAHQGHFMLGRSLLKANQTAAGVRSLKQAVSLEGDAEIYRMLLAEGQMDLDQHDAALSTLAALDPQKVSEKSRAGFGLSLAKATKKSSRTSEAQAAVKRALAADSGSKYLFVALAQLAERQELWGEAFEARASAYDLDSSDYSSGKMAVRAALLMANKTKGADRLDWYEKASGVAVSLAKTKPDVSTYQLAGQARFGAQAYEEAKGWYEKLLAAQPGDARAHYNLGRCALLLEEAEGALIHFEKAQQGSSEVELASAIHEKRGRALRLLERFSEAGVAYGKAGNQVKVAEMKDLEEISENNQAYDLARDRCQEKERQVSALKRENEDLKGTAAWDDLEGQIQDILRDCEQFRDQA